MSMNATRFKLLQDPQGTATVEYLVLSIFVTITACAALATLGPPVMRLFQAQVTWLALPIH